MIRKVGEGVKLRPIDYQFINGIRTRLTSASAIPHDIQETALIYAIYDAATYFYMWYPTAVVRRWVALNTANSYNNDGQGNRVYKLSGNVEGVIEVKEVNGNLPLLAGSLVPNNIGFNILSNAINAPVINNYGNGIETVGSVPYSGSSYMGEYNSNVGYSDGVDYLAQLYVYQQKVSANAKWVYHDFNPLTQEFAILGSTSKNIVLEAFLRIPIENLYRDYYFTKYIVAKGNEHIGKLLLMYDFETIDGYKINAEMLKEDGKEKVAELEEFIQTKLNTPPSSLVL